MYLQVSVCPQGGCIRGRCVCVWQGACVAREGCAGWGACMAGAYVARGACVGQGACPQQILRDTVNERAVRILLECILV